ncbi:MAG: hypothetical protein RMY28_014395 [Nostoc sp. ChiSLP01]
MFCHYIVIPGFRTTQLIQTRQYRFNPRKSTAVMIPKIHQCDRS